MLNFYRFFTFFLSFLFSYLFFLSFFLTPYLFGFLNLLFVSLGFPLKWRGIAFCKAFFIQVSKMLFINAFLFHLLAKLGISKWGNSLSTSFLKFLKHRQIVMKSEKRWKYAFFHKFILKALQGSFHTCFLAGFLSLYFLCCFLFLIYWLSGLLTLIFLCVFYF